MNSQKSGTFSEKPVLVTGGAGFVGSNLIERLIAKYPQIKIVSIDNYFTGTEKNHIKAHNVDYIHGDTRDIAKIWKKTGLPAPKYVFHLGEYSRITQSFEDFDKVWDFNINGTKEVVRFCGNNGAKLIYSGSSSKFGNKGKDENLSPYAWIKAKNVELIVNYSQWFGLEYVITYFFNVYGPRHIREGKYATVIGIFEKLYEKGKPLTVVSPGTLTRDFTHVDDIVEGIIICALKGRGDGYQLGRGKEWPILAVAKMFKTKIEMVPARKGERKKGLADTAKARKLGWEPKINLDDYISDFLKQGRRELNPQ